MPRRAASIFVSLAVLGLAGCSAPQEAGPPSQQEIHSSDSGVTSGEPGRHAYRCDDGQSLLVDFGDKGLRLDLRRPNGAPVESMTAPAPGLQYVGDRLSGTFVGLQLHLVDGDGRSRTCTTQGRR